MSSGWRGIPASPNWFFSGAAAYQHHSGLFVYGAANKLVLLAVSSDSGEVASDSNTDNTHSHTNNPNGTVTAAVAPIVLGTLAGHSAKERVSGVAFSPHAGTAHVCASCGTDGVVQVWDLDAKLSLKQHARHDRKAVAAVVCSAVAARPTVIYSGDVKGLVVAWDYVSGSVSTAAPYTESIISLASAETVGGGGGHSPVGAVLLAVGYKGGGIAVLDFSSGTTASVLHRLKGHAQDVQCLSWRPIFDHRDVTAHPRDRSEQREEKQDEDEDEGEEKKKTKQSMVLCSSGKDRTIKLWTITADTGVETRSWPLPAGRNKRSGGRDSRERVWLTHTWAGADTLVSTSHGGDLLRWDLSSSPSDGIDATGIDGGKRSAAAAGTAAATTALTTTAAAAAAAAAAAPEWTAFPHLGHAHAVFSCVLIPPRSPLIPAAAAAAAAGGGGGGGAETAIDYNVITISSNRQIVRWGCNDGAAKWTLPTIGGHVYTLAGSRADPGAVAMGCGDNLIRVWQTGNTTSYECQTIWKGVQSRVHALSWHPVLEGILAFGLEDGSVGVYDVNKGRHSIAQSTHLRAVTALCWLPPAAGAVHGDADFEDGGNGDDDGSRGASDGIYSLYSCGGDGFIYEHGDPRKAAAAATTLARDVTACIRASLGDDGRASTFEPTTISWHSVGDVGSSSVSSETGAGATLSTTFQTLLAVGCADGAIIICNRALEVLVTLRGQRKRISSLDWSFVEAPADIPLLLLASGSDDSTVRVTSVAAVLASDAARDPLVPCDVAYRHYKLPARATSVAWSMHAKSLLVAGSYDGTAQVWDVAKDVQLANFRGHTAKVLAVLWSPLQPQLVLSGSVDQQVCLWDWTEQPFTVPPQPQKRASKSKKQYVHSGTAGGADTSGGGASNNTEAELSRGAGNGKGRFLRSSTGVSSTTLALSSGTAPGGAGGDTAAAAAAAASGSSLKRSQQRGGHRGDKRSKALLALLPNCGIKQQKVDVAQRACCELATKMYLDEQDAGAGAGDDDQKRATYEGSTEQATAAAALALESLGLFGSRGDAVETIAMASALHATEKRTDASFMLQLWQGTGVEVLEQAMRDRTLTESMVAMSPAAGQSVWSKVAHAYAEQLSKSGEHHRAAGYYLATHNVRKAIDAYCLAGTFEEALAVAKTRLSRHDPAIAELYNAWAKKCESAGHYEQAAKCYLAVRNATAAVQVLSQRGGKRGMLTAYTVAASAGIVSVGLAVRAVQECRRDFDLDAARKIVHVRSDLHSIEHILIVEQELVSIPNRDSSGRVLADLDSWGHLYFLSLDDSKRNNASLVAAITGGWQGMGVASAAAAAALSATEATNILFSEDSVQDQVVLHIRNGVQSLVHAHDAAATASFWLDAMVVAGRSNDLRLVAVLAQHLFLDVILQAHFSQNGDASVIDQSFRSKTTKLGAQMRPSAVAAEGGSGAAPGVSFNDLLEAKGNLLQGSRSKGGGVGGSDGDDAVAVNSEKWEASDGPEPLVAAYYLRNALLAYVQSGDDTIAQTAKAGIEEVLQWASALQPLTQPQQEAFSSQLLI
eukprot:gene12932-27198_t